MLFINELERAEKVGAARARHGAAIHADSEFARYFLDVNGRADAGQTNPEIPILVRGQLLVEAAASIAGAAVVHKTQDRDEILDENAVIIPIRLNNAPRV